MPFTSSFDGQGYIVNGLYFSDSAADCAGLFGCIGSEASIQRLAVSGTVTGGSNVGGICGTNSGTILNCYYLTGTADSGINSEDDGNTETGTADKYF